MLLALSQTRDELSPPTWGNDDNPFTVWLLMGLCDMNILILGKKCRYMQ